MDKVDKGVVLEWYRNRWIVVIRMDFGLACIPIFHNGYVSVIGRLQKQKPNYKKYMSRLHSDELTFAGTVERDVPRKLAKVWFFGFDSAHVWNDEHPESKTEKAVLERAHKLADEMIAKGV